MNKSPYSVALRFLFGILTVITIGSVDSVAQTYTVIPGYTGTGSLVVGSNYYQYNYPNYYRSTQYTYIMFYDYFTPIYTEWIVSAQDMRNAGLCAGPIDAMGLRFIRNPITWNARIRLFVKAIPSTQYTLGYNFTNGGYPDYFFWAVKGMGSNIQAADGGAEVYDNPNFSMQPIATNDTTWVDFPFNKSTFVWDGTSNIVIGLERCQTQYAFQYAEYLVTNVRPPNPYTYYNGNFGSYPMNTGYYYVFYNRSCEQGPAYYILPNFLYEYNYNTGQYSMQALRPLIRLRNLSGVSQSFPDDVDPRYILRATDVYDGSDATHPKPSLTYYSQVGKSYTVTYKLTGPNPGTGTVYQAQQSGSSSITFTGTVNGWTTYDFSEAVGTYAGTAGALDLTNATGGSYRVNATFTSDCGTQQWLKQFIVAFPWDVAMAEIRSPQPPPKKNPLNVTLPLSVQIQNVGLNNITDVGVRAEIRRNGQLIYEHDINWAGNLATGERSVVDMLGKSFIPNQVGLYTAEFCATLNDNIDQQAGNNCLPTTGTYTFQVNYNEEASAGAIIKPTASGSYYANRPFQPAGDIYNNGILDLSDVPVLLEIFKAGGQKVYSEKVLVQSIDAASPYNFAGVVFPLFTPDAAGQYTACMTVQYPGDPDNSNDQVCQTFTVNPNLSGTYTIGTLKLGQARNYPTFELAAADLFLKGVSGPVTFELTDAAYTLSGSASTNNVALDLSGYVPGMSATNTVTFKASTERSLSRGSITITLNSLNGIGVLFGQQLSPSNFNSLAREFPYVRSYSNSAGYYTFDGGLQKSIRVQLGATTALRAPFYLGDGSQNIVLKNLLIGNAPGSTASYAWSLPRIFYTNGQFTYEPDVRTINAVTFTYSGGIVARGKMPVGASGNNAERMDTIISRNNRYEGNEITGFGYGIVTLGIGTLLKSGVNQFQSYYNTGTVVEKNLITNVSRAGIYAGYEDGIRIAGNRIHTVGVAPYVKDAAGIYLGGTLQYNTMAAMVTGNEISGVKADSSSRGIVVEQVRNAYQSVTSTGGIYYAPSRQEQTTVASNVVWGLVRTQTTGSAAGIHLQTGRQGNQLVTPLAADYFTRGDLVANNTVFMTNDNVTGPGAVVGLGIQHGNGTVVKNNAVAMQGPVNAGAMAHAALFVQGTLFPAGSSNDWYLSATAPKALVSDKNAFWAPNAGIGYFVEISEQSEIVSTGSPAEYQTLSQWRTGTGQDISSVQGDFTIEHEYRGVAPNQKLRVKVTPQPPIGSVLNQRGERLASVTTDIDGELRGATGLGYDIGADEFAGRLYVSDLEVIEILKPSAYRSTTGAASDAEYIMTTAPVDVTARVHNNGALPRTNADVRVRIYLETAASNNTQQATPAFNVQPVVDRTVKIDLTSGESKDIMFAIPGFTPQTYQQLTGYMTPTRLSAMSYNVTPRYRITVMTQPDENNSNNQQTKVVRFYLKRAQTSIVVSSRGASTAITGSSPTNDIAGRLNADTLQKALRDLGLINNPGSNIFAYDVFDRAAWENRAVDYTMYRTMFWAHDQTALLRTERDDIRNFIESGVPGAKKNLAMSSQEPVRQHQGSSITADAAFVNTVLRAQYAAPGTPAAPNYSNKRIVGRAIARNSEEMILPTGFTSDDSPVPALMKVYSSPTTPGIAQAAYSYKAGDRTTPDSVAGVATASLTHNVAYIGVDWRHYGRAAAFTGSERVLRGIIDFFESNGGSVVPVELLAFDAKARGTDVDVFWQTASELNADHFDVERMPATGDEQTATSEVTSGSRWMAVATLPAAGTSTERRDYAITDKSLGNGTWLYRLVTVDRDGALERTPAVEVVIGTTAELAVTGLMPQPATTATDVMLRMPQQADVRIDVVNTSGEYVATAFSGTVAQGEHPVSISTVGLPSGSYTLVITSPAGRATTPMTVLR